MTDAFDPNRDYFAELRVPFGAPIRQCQAAYSHAMLALDTTTPEGRKHKARLDQALAVVTADSITRARYIESRRAAGASAGQQHPREHNKAGGHQAVGTAVLRTCSRWVWWGWVVLWLFTSICDPIFGQWVHGRSGVQLIVELPVAWLATKALRADKKIRLRKMLRPALGVIAALAVGAIALGGVAGQLSSCGQGVLLALIVADGFVWWRTPSAPSSSSRLGSVLSNEKVVRGFERFVDAWKTKAPTGQMRMHLNADGTPKRSYTSEVEAWQVAARQGAQEGKPLSAYACKVCSAFHVGHTKD